MDITHGQTTAGVMEFTPNCGLPNTRAFSALGMNQLMDWPITHRYNASKITSRLAQQITRLPIVITARAASLKDHLNAVCEYSSRSCTATISDEYKISL